MIFAPTISNHRVPCTGLALLRKGKPFHGRLGTAVLLLVIASMEIAMPVFAREASETFAPVYSRPSVQQPARATGEYVDGAPVYRLPAVTVVASRKAELARLEREEHVARAPKAAARATSRPAG